MCSLITPEERVFCFNPGGLLLLLLLVCEQKNQLVGLAGSAAALAFYTTEIYNSPVYALATL